MSLGRMKRSGSIGENLSDLKKLPEPDNDICENLLFNIIKKQKKQITIKIYKHLFFNSLVPPICREKYKNDENFDFSLFGVYPTADNPHSIAVADMDGDCSLDVIVSHVVDNVAYLFRNNRSGVFERTETESLHGPAHVITADVNDDGKPDVLTACVNGGYFNVHKSEVAQTGCTDACRADVTHDGVVSIEDFLIIISTWGLCESFGCCGDIDDNGAVNVTDLLIMLNNFGEECDPEERSLAPPQPDDSAPRPRSRR